MKNGMDNANRETIFDELNNFEKKKFPDVSPLLEDYLGLIAKTGNTVFPWLKLRPLFRHKMDKVITEFNVAFPANDLPQSANLEKFEFEEMHVRLLKAVDAFSGTPFTIQRLCELVISPYKQYKRADKFMRALEKDLLIVSTIEPLNPSSKNDPDSSSLVNGISTTSVNGTIESPQHSSSSSDDSSTNTDESSKESESGSDVIIQLNKDSVDSALDVIESAVSTGSEIDMTSIPDSSTIVPDVPAADSITPETMNQTEVSEITKESKNKISEIVEEFISSSSASSEPVVTEPDEPIVDEISDSESVKLIEENKSSVNDNLSIEELPTESESLTFEPDKEVSSSETVEQDINCFKKDSDDTRNVVVSNEVDSSDLDFITIATTVATVRTELSETVATSSSQNGDEIELPMNTENENITDSSVSTMLVETDKTSTEIEHMDQE